MTTLLTQLIDLGKERGFSQNQLAAAAGLHPVTLSRAARSGKCHLSTVESLAAFLGMRLVLVQDNAVASGLARGNLF